MSEKYILKRIPYDQEFDYIITKDAVIDTFYRYFKRGHTIKQCVYGAYHHAWDFDMEEEGMQKFVCMLAGMLFMMEHNQVDRDVAYTTAHDIEVFEHGDYEDLFTPEDLKLLKEDIITVKSWLNDHPEILED